MSRAAQNASDEWIVEYDHAGATWTLQGFFALDADDAKQKLRAIGYTGRIVAGPVKRVSVIALPGIWTLSWLALFFGGIGAWIALTVTS